MGQHWTAMETSRNLLALTAHIPIWARAGFNYLPRVCGCHFWTENEISHEVTSTDPHHKLHTKEGSGEGKENNKH